MIHQEVSFERIPAGDESAGCNHCPYGADYRLTVAKQGGPTHYMQFCEASAQGLYQVIGKLMNPEAHEE